MTALTSQPQTSVLDAPARVAAPSRRALPLWLQLAAVLLACGAVYWPLIGSSGFSQTEGHRVIPGLAMLDSGNWLRSEMFELGYLRKPPGMSWAIAISSALLGPSEFAARAASAAAATLTALMCALFAARWFGRPWAIVAGLAFALMPVTWGYGRSAEIESLNIFMTGLAALSLLELCLPAPEARSRRPAAFILMGAAGILGAALAKGPASAPVVLAVPVAACITLRSARPLASRPLWLALGLAVAVGVPLALAVLRANDDPQTIRQGVAEFMWQADRVGRTLLLAPVAMLAALPVSLVLLFPFGPDAQREAGFSPENRRATDVARTLAISWLLALGTYTAIGISNPRYVFPAAVLLPPLAAYVARGWMGPAPAFIPLRRAIARLSFGWFPAVAPAGLLIAAAIFVPLTERARARASGRGAGERIAAAIAQDADPGADEVLVWADAMIETRPEILLYARRAEPEIRPIWAKAQIMDAKLPPPGSYLLLKTNDTDAEPGRYAAALASGRMRPVLEGTVHKFGYALFRVADR